ncbi:MAG TPA: hypothetical protein VFM96_14495 [Gaiellaceae bacterium]|nr:hypothetical protein [Gaiellaceae bacterium]
MTAVFVGPAVPAQQGVDLAGWTLGAKKRYQESQLMHGFEAPWVESNSPVPGKAGELVRTDKRELREGVREFQKFDGRTHQGEYAS